MQLENRRAIRAKIEVTEGTDIVPTGADNAVLCGNISVTPLGGGTNTRQLAYPSFGATPDVHKDKQVMIQFDVELSGSGAAGVAPAWGVFERMCGKSETIVEDTSVAYAPISTGFESGSLYSNEDGTLHKLLGARGKRSIIYGKDAIPLLRYNIIGRWTTPAAQAMPALTLAAAQLNLPLVMNKDNTQFSIHSYPAVLEAMTVDDGNTVIHRDRPNAEYVAITNRIMGGSVTFEAPALGTKDFFAIAAAGTQGPISLVHGTEDGNIVTHAMPLVQVLEPAHQYIDGIKHLQARLKPSRASDAGDDEETLTLT